MRQRQFSSTAERDTSADTTVRRSRMEISTGIIEIIQGGTVKPTHIMYKINLSWKVMQQYMRYLVDQGLVLEKVRSGKKEYSLSEKGLRLARQIASVKDNLKLQVGKSSDIRKRVKTDSSRDLLEYMEKESDANISLFREMFALGEISPKEKNQNVVVQMKGMLMELQDEKSDAVALLHSFRDET